MLRVHSTIVHAVHIIKKQWVLTKEWLKSSNLSTTGLMITINGTPAFFSLSGYCHKPVSPVFINRRTYM